MPRLLGVALLLASCSTGAARQSPVHDACSQKAQEISVELARIAAQRQRAASEMATEFMMACEEQLQSDLDQTLVNLEAIETAPQVKDSSP